MKNSQDIYALAELAEAAQIEIQARFSHLDPVVGVSRNMRDAGFPVDVMTINSLKNGKRITLLLNDDAPGVISYQFGFRDRDPGALYSEVAFETLTQSQLCDWVVAYFGDKDG